MKTGTIKTVMADNGIQHFLKQKGEKYPIIVKSEKHELLGLAITDPNDGHEIQVNKLGKYTISKTDVYKEISYDKTQNNENKR